jgi:hypothetical protein
MTKLQKLKIWQQRMQAVDAELDKLITVLNVNPESPLLTAVWALQASYSNEVETSITSEPSAEAEWLDWYANENSYGSAALEAGYPDNTKPIKTLENLLELMVPDPKPQQVFTQ